MRVTEQSHFASRLREERATQRARLDDLQSSASSIVDDRGLSDAGRNHSMVQGEARLAQIARAEGRVRAGSYGHCERCGAGIARDRLEARPWTLSCPASPCDGPHPPG